MRNLRISLLLALLAVSGAALAASAATTSKAPTATAPATATATGVDAVILKAIHRIAPKAAVTMIQPAPMAGFHSAVVGGTVVYVRDDGKYLIHGQVYDLSQPKLTDISAAVMNQLREQALAKVPMNERIRFAAKQPKYHVTAFVDVECPFCRQFHSKIAKLQSEGITVDYLLFPLQSIHPQADRMAQAVWCSANREKTYTAAMEGTDPGDAKCKNPVQKIKALGMRLGISATPTLVADDGTLISPRVAQSPKQLAAVLKAHHSVAEAAGG